MSVFKIPYKKCLVGNKLLIEFDWYLTPTLAVFQPYRGRNKWKNKTMKM